MIARDEYLKHLIAFKDMPVVKVITGIRRCGKSTLLMLYADWLKKNGVESKQIISINLESARYDNVKDYKTLYNEVASKIRTDEKYYVLLDEVQNVAEFERAVESLSIDYNVDIYITGSNAYMLSSELATLLSGRYVEVAMLPLSMLNFCSLLFSLSVVTTRFLLSMTYLSPSLTISTRYLPSSPFLSSTVFFASPS